MFQNRFEIHLTQTHFILAKSTVYLLADVFVRQGNRVIKNIEDHEDQITPKILYEQSYNYGLFG